MPAVVRHHLTGMNVDAEALIDGILVDPSPAPDHSTPNEDRPFTEIMAWWRRPYIETKDAPGFFVVHCLDGGAWDRPTQIGAYKTLPDAVKAAKAYRPQLSETHSHA